MSSNLLFSMEKIFGTDKESVNLNIATKSIQLHYEMICGWGEEIDRLIGSESNRSRISDLICMTHVVMQTYPLNKLLLGLSKDDLISIRASAKAILTNYNLYRTDPEVTIIIQAGFEVGSSYDLLRLRVHKNKRFMQGVNGWKLSFANNTEIQPDYLL